MIYLFLIISIIFDYLYPYYIPSFFNQLNLFYPMFTLTYIVFIYKKINNKKYFKNILIAGIIYDLFFSYLLLFHLLLFILFYKLINKIDKIIQINIFVKILMLIFFIFLYDLILFILVYISGYSLVTINDLLYKFTHSIILNILYFLWLEIIFKNSNINSLKKKK